MKSTMKLINIDGNEIDVDILTIYKDYVVFYYEDELCSYKYINENNIMKLQELNEEELNEINEYLNEFVFNEVDF